MTCGEDAYDNDYDYAPPTTTTTTTEDAAQAFVTTLLATSAPDPNRGTPTTTTTAQQQQDRSEEFAIAVLTRLTRAITTNAPMGPGMRTALARAVAAAEKAGAQRPVYNRLVALGVLVGLGQGWVGEALGFGGVEGGGGVVGGECWIEFVGFEV